jgi:hypothetical protein
MSSDTAAIEKKSRFRPQKTDFFWNGAGPASNARREKIGIVISVPGGVFVPECGRILAGPGETPARA